MQKFVFITSFIISTFVLTYAQEPITDVDKYFIDARQNALDKKYQKARLQARNLLSHYPEYHDAGVLIARTYAWEQKFDSARYAINSVLDSVPHYRDAILTVADIEFWSGNTDKAIEILDKELQLFPNDKELVEKKMQILMAAGREKEAQDYLASLLRQNPYNYQVNLLLSKSKKYKKRFIAEHTLDWYNKPNGYVWQCYSLQYQREANWGTWIGKANVGQLMVDNKNVTPSKSFQFEGDAYPKIDSISYLYLNLGVSPGEFFPTIRTGIEYFRSLSNNWEASFGGRYLYFKDGLIKNTYIITGSIGKYFSSNWLSYRPFLIFNSEKTAHSHYIFYRHYLGNVYNYIGGAIGIGSSPDETINKSGQLIQSFSESYRIRLDFQQKFGNQFIFRIMLGNTFEEYQPQNYRYRFDSNIYLAWLF